MLKHLVILCLRTIEPRVRAYFSWMQLLYAYPMQRFECIAFPVEIVLREPSIRYTLSRGI